jgi:anti-sigma regulatory factor (Ser/Thr protein kinase)
MPDDKSFISLDNNLDEVARLGEWVTAFCERSQLGAKLEFELNLALEELLTNAFHHGGASRVDVNLRFEGVQLEAEVVDDGTAFDPTAAAPPDLAGSIDDRKVGGLGIHLVRRLVQDLAYERRGSGNRVSFRMAVR